MPDPHFEGDVETRWLVGPDEDRKMEMRSELAFVDSTDYRWAARNGEKVEARVFRKSSDQRLLGHPSSATTVVPASSMTRNAPSFSIPPYASSASSGISNAVFARCSPYRLGRSTLIALEPHWTMCSVTHSASPDSPLVRAARCAGTGRWQHSVNKRHSRAAACYVPFSCISHSTTEEYLRTLPGTGKSTFSVVQIGTSLSPAGLPG